MLLAISIQAYISWSGYVTYQSSRLASGVCDSFCFLRRGYFRGPTKSPSLFDHGSELPDSVLTMAMLVGILGLFPWEPEEWRLMHLFGHKTFQLPLLEVTTLHTGSNSSTAMIGIVVNVFGVPFFGTCGLAYQRDRF